MTKNVLIVNPDIDEALSIKNRVTTPITYVVCAHTIDEALSAFRTTEFCLVILDAAMSASDDHNLLKAMRSSHTAPILLLSSNASTEERIHAFNSGAHAYMGKPYTDEECLAQAHALMQLYIQRPKYYVENNHPAIIDSATFARVQEELSRRTGKRKVKQVGTKTEQGKYSSKYALTERLLCGECKTPYRRCTWTVKGQKKIVWRCINRLDFGKKYCHESPTVEEGVLHEAIMRAIMETAQQNIDVLKTLKVHIGMGLRGEETEDISLSLQIRMAEIDAEFNAMLNAISSDEIDKFDEQRASELLNEKNSIQSQLAEISESRQKRESTESRLNEIYTILDGLKNHPMEYDDQIVRQIIECVIVESKEQIRVIFAGGLEVTQSLI